MKKSIIILFLTFSCGWMLVDGTRAFILGDYVTPQTGQFAGQLGPWSMLISAIGIEPRSTLMKAVFVLYGLIGVSGVIAFGLNKPWARNVLIAVAVFGLWYLPIGTVVNLVALGLLLTYGK